MTRSATWVAALVCLGVALTCAATAHAEDLAPPAGAAPAAPVAPPPASDLLVPPQPARTMPIYPTDQPGYTTPPPREMPTSRDFDRTVRAVGQRCAPRQGPVAVPRMGCRPCSRGYAGANVQAYPGLGFGVEWGVWFAENRAAKWAFEVGLSYQDLTDGFNNISTGESGKWMGARVGIKASFLPKCNSHPTLRAGFAWNVATGDVDNTYDIGDITATSSAVNYYGGYLGIGWEWDLFGGRITTGPEIFGFAGVGDRDSGEAYTASVAWHFLVNL